MTKLSERLAQFAQAKPGEMVLATAVKQDAEGYWFAILLDGKPDIQMVFETKEKRDACRDDIEAMLAAHLGPGHRAN